MTGPDLARRAVAELLGTALLVAIVVGSGIAAQRLSPDDLGLQLLENSTATAFGLTVLILVLGPLSGAHLNPVVTLAFWFTGRGADTGLASRDVGVYVVAQATGAVAGTELAHLMYDVSLTELGTRERGGAGVLLGEVVATAGLLLVISALVRTGAGLVVAPAVGAYIGAAYWFTSSTSFANPAVTVGRAFTDTFAGIAPGSVPGFVLAQLVGAALAVAAVGYLYPLGEHAMTEQTTPAQVVFACVRNGGRSVIGRVLTEHYAGDHVLARSAGTQPGEHIHPEVAAALGELGLDTSREEPALLTRETVAASDLAVTLGCGEECPYVPGVRYVDWPVDDPGGQDPATVRRIIADLDARVRTMLTELVPGIALPASVLDG